MSADQDRAEAQRRAQITSVEQRLAAVRTRMDQAYEDKLDRRLDEQMWTRKMRDWRDQEKELSKRRCIGSKRPSLVGACLRRSGL